MYSLVVDFMKGHLDAEDFNYFSRVANIAKKISAGLQSVDETSVVFASYLLGACWIRHEKTPENIGRMDVLSMRVASEVLKSMKYSDKTVDDVCLLIEKSDTLNNDSAEQQIVFEAGLLCRIGAGGLYYWGSVLGFEKYYEMLVGMLDDIESCFITEKGKALAMPRIEFSRNLVESFKREMKEGGYMLG